MRRIAEAEVSGVYLVSEEPDDPRIDRWTGGDELEPPLAGWPEMHFATESYRMTPEIQSLIKDAVVATNNAEPLEDWSVKCAFTPDYRIRYDSLPDVHVLAGGYGSKTCADIVQIFQGGELLAEINTFGDEEAQDKWTRVYEALEVAAIPTEETRLVPSE